MSIKPWKTISSQYVHNDRWLKVRADRCETPDGTIVDPYYIHEPPDWVHVVAFDSEDRLLITYQYRHGSNSISPEIPCGCLEPGESPLEAIKRELLEETGCSAETIEPLPPVSPNPARYSNRIYPFIARGTVQIRPPQCDATEEIEFEFVPIPTVISWIETGWFQQPLHHSSIFLALLKRGVLKLNCVEQPDGGIPGQGRPRWLSCRE